MTPRYFGGDPSAGMGTVAAMPQQTFAAKSAQAYSSISA